jgi:hypothetical protein
MFPAAVPFVSAAASPAGAGDATAPSGIAGGSAVQAASKIRINPNSKKLETRNRVDISGFPSKNTYHSHRPPYIVFAGKLVRKTPRHQREFRASGSNTAWGSDIRR